MLLTEPQLELIKIATKSFCAGPFHKERISVYRPFVYDRSYGAFILDIYHERLMAVLYMFHMDYPYAQMLDEVCGVKCFGYADKFLKEIPGTCYLSSCGVNVEAGLIKNLTASEHKFFGDVDFIFEPLE